MNNQQPAPTPTAGPAIWDLVIADMHARDQLGRAKYGTPLQANNGRDALLDAYQEALDLCVYLRQGIAERDGTPQLPTGPGSLVAAMQELRDAGGDGWDKIDDPEAFLREVRGIDAAYELMRRKAAAMDVMAERRIELGLNIHGWYGEFRIDGIAHIATCAATPWEAIEAADEWMRRRTPQLDIMAASPAQDAAHVRETQAPPTPELPPRPGD